MYSRNIVIFLVVSIFGFLFGALVAVEFTGDVSRVPKEDVNQTQNVTIEVPLYEPSRKFDISGSWSSEVGWKDEGVDIFRGEVKNGIYRIRKGFTYAHFAKKFKERNFQIVKVQVEIPDSERNSVELYIGTGSEGEKNLIEKLRFTDLPPEKRKRVGLESGVNNVNLRNFRFSDYTFFKFILRRDSQNIKSPILEQIKID